MSSIYSDLRKFVLDTFTGTEQHQELRKKIIMLPIHIRRGIKELAALSGCNSKKDQVAEAVYWIIKDLKEEPFAVCPVCSKRFSGRYHSIVEGYKFHDHCSSSCRNKNPDYIKKLAVTNLTRYGHRNNMHGTDVRNKTKQKWVEKYGFDAPIKAEAIKAKVRATNQARRGVDWPAQDKLVWAKYEATMLKRYGVNNGFNLESVKNTCIKRYGVPNPMMHPSVFKKTLRGLRSTKQGTLPSGDIYMYQGYEDVAVNKLLELVEEHELVVGDPTKLPVIEYFNPVKQKSCRYFPDIWIPHLKLLVEVKSSWTMKRQLEENMAKHHAALRLGFKHEIWICSKSAVIEVLI